MTTKKTTSKNAEVKEPKNVKEVKDLAKVESCKVKNEAPKKSNIIPIEEIFNSSNTENKKENTSKDEVKKTETTTRNESMRISKSQGKTFEKQPSAGKQIREMFESVIPKLKDEQLEILTSAEKTKEVLKIRYAFLKESTENKEDRKVNGNARYGSKTITINDKSYWCCNDLYERNIETFKKWVETIR